MTTQATQDEREEIELVQAAQKDRRQFAPLYERYFVRIYRYIVARVGDSTLAEDITSEVFMSVLKNLPQYRPNTAFAAWIFTIARNKVASYFRDKRVEYRAYDIAKQEIDRANPFQNCVEDASDLMQLRQWLMQFSDKERELLYMRFAGGLTYKEIALVLDRSPDAIKVAIFRLLRKLKYKIEAQDEQPI